MTPERWHRATEVFHQALAVGSATRVALIERGCAGDDEVRAEVDRLLAAHERASRFGEAPLGALQRLAGSGREPVATATASEHAAPHNHPPDHASRRHRFTWIVWAATAVTCGVFAYAATLLVSTAGRTASFGWTEEPRAGQWYVARVEAQGAAARTLEVGDRVVALNGVAPLGDSGTRVHRRQLAVGDAYRLVSERRGRLVESSLKVADGPRELGTRLIYYFVSLVWCAVGLFIGLARPEQPVARLAFLAAVGTGLVFLGGFVPSVPLVSPMHVVVGFHFFSRFPAGPPVTGLWKGILIPAYGVAAIPVALSWWFQLTLLTQGTSGVADLVAAHGVLLSLRGPANVYLFYALLVGMVWAAVHRYRALTSDDERLRVRWVVVGSVLSFLPQVALSVAEVVIGGPQANEWIGLPANAATAGIPLVVAYAVVKHRVFGIKVVVRRGVRYLLARHALQTAVAVPAIALAYTAFRHRSLTLVALATETSGYLYWLGAAGLTLRFRRSIESWLDHRFFREEYDKERLVLGLMEDVRKADSLSDVSRLTSERLASALHPSSLCVWYRDSAEVVASSDSAQELTPPDVPSSGSWLAWLEQHGAATPVPRGVDVGLSRADVHWFASRGISLIVPMMDAGERLVGALLLGGKRSEEPYSVSDRRLLEAIAKQIADVREMLRLRARVNDEVRVRHDVLARLDGRLAAVLKECPTCGACFEGAAEQCDRDGAVLRLSLPVARTIDGKYRLVRLIGKGGMGAVYEAQDVRLGRAVAVKIMLSRAFGEQAALRRFRREARAAAHLAHPNVVGVFDVGALEGEGAYLVMELVRGRTLRAELDRETRLLPAVAAEWFGPILDGTAAAHAAGITHRDLKPENVIGHRDDTGSLTVKLLDLGLVKFSADAALATGSMTVDGLVMGTPAYMSPEQIRGADVDERADMFSVGVMLVESLTGRRPYQGNTLAELQLAQQRTPYRLTATSVPAQAVADLVQQCLRLEPHARLASAAAMRHALIPLLMACTPLDFVAESRVTAHGR